MIDRSPRAGKGLMQRFMCWMGMHDGVFRGGGYHKYYVCKNCTLRYVVKGTGGYQPLRQDWLDGGNWKAKRGKKPLKK